jgi:hypothetical protein
MKKIAAIALICVASLSSAFTGLDMRPSFAYEVFSSPYYRILKKTVPAANARIGFVPVAPDARALEMPTYKDAQIPALLNAITTFAQDSLKLQKLNVSAAKPTDAPDMFLGSILQGQRPLYVTLDCASAKESPENCLRIAGQAGSKAWMQQLQAEMAKQNLDYALVLQLGEGYIYPNGKIKQVNAVVSKRQAPPAGLDMGTDFWLPMTQKWVATNKPIDVLFVKGLLIGKDGKIIRAGGEGITAASKAKFMEQVVNISHEFSEAELKSVEHDLRRDDLPGQPLNWQVATRQLVKTLANSNFNTSNGYVKP